MRLSIALAALLGLGVAALAQAAALASDKYAITESEKAACTMDAIRFCSGAYPNEDRLLACMRRNHSSLSSTCRVAFDEGIRRRRL